MIATTEMMVSMIVQVLTFWPIVKRQAQQRMELEHHDQHHQDSDAGLCGDHKLGVLIGTPSREHELPATAERTPNRQYDE